MAVGFGGETRPSMPNDLFILNLSNQAFMLGTSNLWYVGTRRLGIFLLIAIPLCILVSINISPIHDPDMNKAFIGLIIFVPLAIAILVGVRKYLYWVKLSRMKRDGQILIGKITNIKTHIYRSSRDKGAGTRISKIRCEFKNPTGKELATYTKYRRTIRSPLGKSVAILYVSDDDFMVL